MATTEDRTPLPSLGHGASTKEATGGYNTSSPPLLTPSPSSPLTLSQPHRPSLSPQATAQARGAILTPLVFPGAPKEVMVADVGRKRA